MQDLAISFLVPAYVVTVILIGRSVYLFSHFMQLAFELFMRDEYKFVKTVKVAFNDEMHCFSPKLKFAS